MSDGQSNHIRRLDSVLDLVSFLKDRNKIFLFGAGTVGKRLCRILTEHGIDIKGFIVSDAATNPALCEGKPVVDVEGLKKIGYDCNQIFVIVALSRRPYQAADFLIRNEIKHTLILNYKCINDIWLTDLREIFDRAGGYMLCTDNDPDIEPVMAHIIDRNTKRAISRTFMFINISYFKEYIDGFSKEKFEDYYGKLLLLPHGKKLVLSKGGLEDKSIEIYVMSGHLNRSTSQISREEPGRIVLQVGAALTEKNISTITDDTGDNISERNINYSECTGLYWIWKNTDGQDYIGLEHYRRALAVSDEDIDYIYDNEIDAIMPIPQFSVGTPIWYFVEHQNHIGDFDWDQIKESILRYDKSYSETVEKYEETHFFFPCNMFIMKRKWFDRYCEFAFYVSFEIEKWCEEKGIIRANRYMGYIFENLMSLFIMRHYSEMSIRCTEILWKGDPYPI